jgi:hypothetical protein
MGFGLDAVSAYFRNPTNIKVATYIVCCFIFGAGIGAITSIVTESPPPEFVEVQAKGSDTESCSDSDVESPGLSAEQRRKKELKGIKGDCNVYERLLWDRIVFPGR